MLCYYLNVDFQDQRVNVLQDNIIQKQVSVLGDKVLSGIILVWRGAPHMKFSDQCHRQYFSMELTAHLHRENLMAKWQLFFIIVDCS